MARARGITGGIRDGSGMADMAVVGVVVTLGAAGATDMDGATDMKDMGAVTLGAALMPEADMATASQAAGIAAADSAAEIASMVGADSTVEAGTTAAVASMVEAEATVGAEDTVVGTGNSSPRKSRHGWQHRAAGRFVFASGNSLAVPAAEILARMAGRSTAAVVK